MMNHPKFYVLFFFFLNEKKKKKLKSKQMIGLGHEVVGPCYLDSAPIYVFCCL